MKKYYIIYKITNNLTKKFYIGAHETTDINDGYMGSGVYLIRAQKKYGIEHFSKEILYELDSSEEMYNKEKEIVEINEYTYNVMPGGNGGWQYARSKITSESHKKCSETMKTPEYLEKTKTQRINTSNRMKDNPLMANIETRNKVSKSRTETMNNPEWVATTGAKRAEAISKSVKLLHASGKYKERDKKLSVTRTGMKQATLNNKKIWVKENDPRINELGFHYGW